MLTSPNVDNQSGVLCNWHDTNHHALCQVYQEFAYQTTYISADFSMDSFPKDVTKPIVQQVQIVAKIVPISQIRIMIPRYQYEYCRFQPQLGLWKNVHGC